eukprot:9345120-Alexandrium_andersonii.AAC.1
MLENWQHAEAEQGGTPRLALAQAIVHFEGLEAPSRGSEQHDRGPRPQAQQEGQDLRHMLSH